MDTGIGEGEVVKEEAEDEDKESDSVVVVYNVTVVGGGQVVPTGIISAGGRVFAAIPVLDARIEEEEEEEEGVDDIETREDRVGEEDKEDFFVMGDGIDEEEVAKPRIKTSSMESRGLTAFSDDDNGEGGFGKARGTPAWEQNCWAVFIVAVWGRGYQSRVYFLKKRRGR